jgi:hypothetical protein
MFCLNKPVVVPKIYSSLGPGTASLGQKSKLAYLFQFLMKNRYAD